MRLPRSRLALVLTVVAVVVLAVSVTAAVGLSTGSGLHLGPVTKVGPPPRIEPQIVKFDGPGIVRCSKAGAAVTIRYAYATLRASVVQGRIDGVKRGVRRVGSPARGTMLFRYVCSGPHTIGIIARATSGATATASVRFNKKNHAVSSTASREVEASP